MGWRTTERADEDIADIEIYGTLTFGRRLAEVYIDDLFAAFRLLAISPRIVPERQDLPETPRVYPFRSHQVIYRLEEEDIVIVRVLHAKQDRVLHL